MTPALAVALLTTAALTLVALLPTDPPAPAGLHLVTTGPGCTDLTGWAAPPTPDPVRYPLIVGTKTNTAPSDMCVANATVRGNTPDAPWQVWMADGVSDGTGVRVFTGANATTIVGARVDNVADSFDLHGTSHAGTVRIEGAYASNGKDDVLENDDLLNVVVVDSLLESFVVISERPAGTRHAPGTGPQTLVLDHVIAWAQPQKIICKPGREQYCADGLGGHVLFKQSGAASAHVVVTDSILRVDRRSYSSDAGMVLPAGTYTNVTLVWLGDGAYPGPIPAGVTVTSDVTVYENAKRDWLIAHPGVNR